MLNLRRLKKDFPPAILKEGKVLFDKEQVLSVKIVSINAETIRLSCTVVGNFEHQYDSEIEIDRRESTIIDSDCNCPYKYDCAHLAAVLFYLEEHVDELVVSYSKETDIETSTHIKEADKKHLRETIKEAETKEVVRRGKKHHKELLHEYIEAAGVLAKSPYFVPEETVTEDKAELAVIILPNAHPQKASGPQPIELQLALRLPYRSKPLHIPHARAFIEAVRYSEQLYIGSKRYLLSLQSFDPQSLVILQILLESARFPEGKEESHPRLLLLPSEAFGRLLEQATEPLMAYSQPNTRSEDEILSLPIPHLYCGSLEVPLRFSKFPALIHIALDYINSSAPKLLLVPSLRLENGTAVRLENVILFECSRPGLLYRETYSRFSPAIKRKHLRHLAGIRDITIPEPLFGTFIENGIPELTRFAEISGRETLDRFVTLPFVGELKAVCDINYLNGELEATLHFLYDKIIVPAAVNQLTLEQIDAFSTPDGILARNLAEEQKIIDDLFQDFQFDPKQSVFLAKTDKKIVEFMTEVIPRNQRRVTFNCPENLLDRFLYDNSEFTLHLSEGTGVDKYQIEVKVEGQLKGLTLDMLWDCVTSKRSYIELQKKKSISKRKNTDMAAAQPSKILVLDLDRLTPVVQVFDELGIRQIDDHVEQKPLWSLASIHPDQFDDLAIAFSMTPKLLEIQQQMLGLRDFIKSPVPLTIKATLPSYQVDGVAWLERLRQMHLNGILADDMGLGKTLQAIIAMSQHKNQHANALSIVVCPTSLIYNWKEECSKFNPSLRVLPVDGTPTQRKKLLTGIGDYDVVVTSYSLLQKDIDFYQSVRFSYAILDEAQHIKNRSTRNAKSVKMLQAKFRLILTGTPIENSLDELWSLFDFLMPGLLSSYERFIEKYVRNVSGTPNGKHLEHLRRKISPFVLRRMKKDLLTDLPPVSEIVYHCHLSESQRDLYKSYAASAREELSRLVKKEGFEKVQIHVLATLTRLKQICCHPAIFAKDKPEPGDSAKYDMLLELLESLIEGGHRTVVFSQYTRMLNIMRNDLERQGIPFCYLDGSSKNRMSIVKEFNENTTIPVFLVSLKAGGSGLNLTGADTVIHYDMWWNPAVESQATDRIHRIGQTAAVSAYKLVSLNTIEEKIVELQNRKRGLVKKIVSCDDEAMAKLTWEEVLELLQV
jgi:SNF2 family DNA or RNA helicase